MTAFIYALTDPNTNEVRYLGKANNVDARFKGHLRDMDRRKTPVYSWMRKLWESAKHPKVTTIAVCGNDWQATERLLIAGFRERGARLLNLADGGDEPYCSPEVRRQNGKNSVERRREEAKRCIDSILKQLGETTDATKRKNLTDFIRDVIVIMPKEYKEAFVWP